MKKITFRSFPDFSDNSFAIFYFLLKREYQARYIWLIDNMSKIDIIKKKFNVYFPEYQFEEKCEIIKKNSILGLYHYITSNYVFLTHGGFEFIPQLPWLKKINLWHGMPLKKIGVLTAQKSPKFSKTISTSTLFDNIILKCFDIEYSQLIKSGLPRNDFLYLNNTQLKNKLNLDKFNNIIMWLPTYRKHLKSEYIVDGAQNETILNIDLDIFNEINKNLYKMNRILLIKLHPMDSLNTSINENNYNFTNIKILNNTYFDNLYCEVNHLLSLADLLITDYSSVLFDYALLNRPVLIYKPDEELYEATRGFTDYALIKILKDYKVINNKQQLLDIFLSDLSNIPILSKKNNESINEYALSALEEEILFSSQLLNEIGFFIN